MPNHVHLLISPKILVPRIMNGLKGVTAHDANLILGRESISGRTNPSITGFALSGSSTASAPTSNSIPFPRVWLLVRRTGPGPAPPTTGNLSSRGTACSCGTANHGRARTQCALTECREAPPPTQPVPEDSAQVTKSGETMLLFLLPPLCSNRPADPKCPLEHTPLHLCPVVYAYSFGKISHDVRLTARSNLSASLSAPSQSR